MVRHCMEDPPFPSFSMDCASRLPVVTITVLLMSLTLFLSCLIRHLC
jgi:hypothetical protein